jgi:N-acetylglucosamine-6-sulfatase
MHPQDHGYKQGQWRIGTSKQHPYDTDIRVPLLARGPGIKPGSVFVQPSGNVDLTPTILTIAGGAAYVPPFMDGRSMTAFLTPSLEARDVLAAKPWRPHFLNEYKSVGTYYNDHSKCWGNDVINGRTCPGTMPRSPLPVPDAAIAGLAVIEGEDETMFVPANAVSAAAGCVESTGIGDGNCYFVDSTHSNNWRQLRIVGGEDGVDMNYIEYDPEFAFVSQTNLSPSPSFPSSRQRLPGLCG